MIANPEAAWVIFDMATGYVRCRRCLTSVPVRGHRLDAVLNLGTAFLTVHAKCKARVIEEEQLALDSAEP